jgi:hypothetical protein
MTIDYSNKACLRQIFYISKQVEEIDTDKLELPSLNTSEKIKYLQESQKVITDLSNGKSQDITLEAVIVLSKIEDKIYNLSKILQNESTIETIVSLQKSKEADSSSFDIISKEPSQEQFAANDLLTLMQELSKMEPEGITLETENKNKFRIWFNSQYGSINIQDNLYWENQLVSEKLGVGINSSGEINSIYINNEPQDSLKVPEPWVPLLESCIILCFAFKKRNEIDPSHLEKLIANVQQLEIDPSHLEKVIADAKQLMNSKV